MKKLLASGTMRIGSVSRVIDILEFLATADGGQASLSQLSAAVQTNASTVHHLLATLKERRLVVQDAETRMYALGEHLIELGQLALRGLDLATLARPVVLALRAATGQDCSFILFRGYHRSVLVRARAKGLVVRPAMRLAAEALPPVAEHATAAGKVLLAFLAEESLQQFLAGVALYRYTDRTIPSAAELRTELESVRRRELAVDRGECDPLIGCLAAPVRDASFRVIGCLDVIFSLRDDPDQSVLAESVQQQASELSGRLQALGYRAE